MSIVVRHSTRRPFPTLLTAVLALLAFISLPAVAAAQTTVTLADPGSEITDNVTIRGGGYAGVNFATDDTLVTKKSSDSSNTRRVLMKFNTKSTIPAGTTISKATLTLTLKSAGATSTRPIGLYRVTKSFLQGSANWLDYRSGTSWSSQGGDLAEKWASASVGRTSGSKVSFDVTSFVQKTVSGGFGTRYTRFALVDTGTADNESAREFYSSRASTVSVRPKLVVTYGSSTSGSSTSSGGSTTTSSSTGTTLKVLQFNTHHGVGKDGRYDLNRIATLIVNQNPDVVSLNEVMYHDSNYGGGEDQPATYKRLLQEKTGRTWYSVYARMDGNWGSTSWAGGVQLLSRIPFSTTTRYALSYDRSVAQGTIVRNGRTVNLFSTHVEYYHSSWRPIQTTQVKNWAATWAENRIVMGDFNTSPGSNDYWIMANYYNDSWAGAVKNGTYSSSSGTSGLTTGGSRFDYIYESKGAAALSLKSMSVISTSISDHNAVVATFNVN